MSSGTSGFPLVVVGDWHGHQGWGLTAIRSAAREGAKVIIHVGDFGFDWPGAKRNRYEARLNRSLLEHGITLIVSPGNHDNHDTIEKLRVESDGLASFRSNIMVLPKGGRTEIQGLRIGGLGGAFSVDKEFRQTGKDWWANEEPTAEDAEKLVAGGPLDVLITHDAPAGVPLISNVDLSHDLVEQSMRTRLLLRTIVETLAPPHVFCGHWHQRVIHQMTHSDGRFTRVDVLNMENSRYGNGVMVWPGTPPLRVEPLDIRSN